MVYLVFGCHETYFMYCFAPKCFAVERIICRSNRSCCLAAALELATRRLAAIVAPPAAIVGTAGGRFGVATGRAPWPEAQSFGGARSRMTVVCRSELSGVLGGGAAAGAAAGAEARPAGALGGKASDRGRTSSAATATQSALSACADGAFTTASVK